MWITRRLFARICECLTGHLRSYGTVKVRIDVTFWTNHIARNQCSNTTPSHHGQATMYCITKIFQCFFSFYVKEYKKNMYCTLNSQGSLIYPFSQSVSHLLSFSCRKSLAECWTWNQGHGTNHTRKTSSNTRRKSYSLLIGGSLTTGRKDYTKINNERHFNATQFTCWHHYGKPNWPRPRVSELEKMSKSANNGT